MKVLDILQTASQNMFRSKLRTSLTVIAIFIGAFTLTLTNGLGSGISRYIDAQVASLGAEDILIIMPAGNDVSGLPSDTPKKYDPNRRTTSIESEGNRTVTVMTDADLTKIKNVEGIKSALAYQSASINYVVSDGDKYVAAIDRFLSGEKFPLDSGAYPDNANPGYEILLPSSYLEPLGLGDAQAAVGKTISFGVTNGLGQVNEVKGTISGVQQKNLVGGNSLYLNDALAEELIRVQDVGLPAAATSDFQAAIARFDSSLPDKDVQAIKDRLKTAGYKAQTVEDQIGTFKSVIAGIIAVLNGFAIIALLAASFGIINTLLMSVQERTKEIGLMKAMGMGSGRIFMLFSFEATMLGFWGSAIGSLAAIGAGAVISNIVTTSFLKDLVGLKLLVFTPTSVGAIIGIVMAIAFLAGTLPAIRAARQNPIDSLRYE